MVTDADAGQIGYEKCREKIYHLFKEQLARDGGFDDLFCYICDNNGPVGS